MQKEVKMSDGGAQTPWSRTPTANGAAPIQSAVSEIDRTVKVRWPVEGDGGSVTADRVKTLFSKFGQIESADLLNPKMLRLGKKQKRQLAVVCMIQYKSVVGAHAAIEDFLNKKTQNGRHSIPSFGLLTKSLSLSQLTSLIEPAWTPHLRRLLQTGVVGAPSRSLARIPNRLRLQLHHNWTVMASRKGHHSHLSRQRLSIRPTRARHSVRGLGRTTPVWKR